MKYQIAADILIEDISQVKKIFSDTIKIREKSEDEVVITNEIISARLNKIFEKHFLMSGFLETGTENINRYIAEIANNMRKNGIEFNIEIVNPETKETLIIDKSDNFK